MQGPWFRASSPPQGLFPISARPLRLPTSLTISQPRFRRDGRCRRKGRVDRASSMRLLDHGGRAISRKGPRRRQPPSVRPLHPVGQISLVRAAPLAAHHVGSREVRRCVPVGVEMPPRPGVQLSRLPLVSLLAPSAATTASCPARRLDDARRRHRHATSVEHGGRPSSGQRPSEAAPEKAGRRRERASHGRLREAAPTRGPRRKRPRRALNTDSLDHGRSVAMSRRRWRGRRGGARFVRRRPWPLDERGLRSCHQRRGRRYGGGMKKIAIPARRRAPPASAAAATPREAADHVSQRTAPRHRREAGQLRHAPYACRRRPTRSGASARRSTGPRRSSGRYSRACGGCLRIERPSRHRHRPPRPNSDHGRPTSSPSSAAPPTPTASSSSPAISTAGSAT